jgi:hypothetical protein
LESWGQNKHRNGKGINNEDRDSYRKPTGKRSPKKQEGGDEMGLQITQEA